MSDWPIFLMGLIASSIVLTAVVTIAREDRTARDASAAKARSSSRER